MADNTDFWLEPGHVALDLSLSGGRDWRSRWERLHTPADLDAWFEACSLHLTGVTSTDSDLAAAHDLREGLWSATQAAASGTTPPAEAIETINRHAQHPPLRRHLSPGGEVTWDRPTAPAALSTIADEAIELLGTHTDISRLKRCEGERCHLLFVDTSPARRRRWCSMERCGNRHKVRTHRSRQQASDEIS